MFLFPRPRKLEMSEPGPRRDDLDVRAEPGPELPAEGYELVIDETGAEIRFADGGGRRYAQQTLDQIVDQSTGRIPGLHIRDHPDFAVRGYMLDISRDRVPTRATLERIVGLMSVARLNHLQLYTEHTFAYRDHEVVWRNASPMTPDDIRWLDDLCASHGIELAANQNSFGHMERWLRHEPYRQRAECPDGYDMMGTKRPPSTLAPTPDNARFSLDLLRELLGNFTSKRVNIGCDETFELGKGSSAPEVAERGKARVFADHLLRLVEPLASEGYQVLFWADMLRSNPELVSELPEGVTPIAWTYERPAGTDETVRELPEAVVSILDEIGVDLDAHRGFATNVRPLAEAGIPFWVAPGTSSWNSLVGRLDNSLENIADAAEVGRRHGSEGLLLTDWGDGGHIQPPSISFLSLVYAGAMAWGGEANRDLDIRAVCDRLVFYDQSGILTQTLDRAGRLWRRTGQRSTNSSPLFGSLFPHQMHFTMGSPDRDKMTQVVSKLEGALEALDDASPTCTDADIVLREVRNAVRLARHGAWRLLAQAGGPERPKDELRRDLEASIEEHRACWLERSRPGGLDDSTAHLIRTLETYS